MAHEQHLASDKKTLQQQQEQQQQQQQQQQAQQHQHVSVSPDNSFSTAPAIPTTAVPPSPPPSSPSSTASLTTSPSSRPRLGPRTRRRAVRTAAPGLPKSVASAHRCIQEAQRGRYAGPSWLEYSNVCPADLKALVSAVEATGAAYYKLRYDYDPTAEFLILRMPEGKPHNFTKTGLEKAIWERLKERLRLGLAEITREDGENNGDEEEQDHGPTRLQALQLIESSILSTTEAELKLSTDKNTKFPDISFYYKGHVYPPLVVEVGHSQKGHALPLLAREYIEKTSGDIQTVITVDIDHNKREQRNRERRRQRSKQEEGGRVTRSRSRQRQSHLDADDDAGVALKSMASLSLFRLGRRILCDKPFRDSHGNQVEGSLKLNIADFVPQDADIPISRTALEALTFSVPFTCLYNALISGKQLQALEEETPPPESEVQRTKKRVKFEFDWDAGPPTGQEETDIGGSSHELRSSLSKRRRTNLDQEPRDDRPGSSHHSEQGRESSERRVIASRRRRRSSSHHQEVSL